MVGRNRKTKKTKSQPKPMESPPVRYNYPDLNTFTDAFQVNLPSTTTSYGWTDPPTMNRPIDTVATISNTAMVPHSLPATSTRISPQHYSHYVDNWNSIIPELSPPTNNDTYPNNASDDYDDFSNLTNSFLFEPLFDIWNDVNIMPFSYPNSLYTPAPLTPAPLTPTPLTPPSPPLALHGQSSLLIQSAVVTEPPVMYQPPLLLPPVPPEALVPSRHNVPRPTVRREPPVSSRPRVPRPAVPPQPPVPLVPTPSTSKGKGKNTCYSNWAPNSSGIKRNKDHENTKEQVKKIKINGEPQLPKAIEEMITQEISRSTDMERKDGLPAHNILSEGELERILESVEQVDGVSSRNFNEVFHYLQDGGLYEDMSEEEDQNDKPKDDEKKAEETENENKNDPYEFNEERENQKE